ncbi:MAG: hypothetical protein GX817_07285 [Elusimicrobia bacterium]|nr:hypothetical protein [Elusimicrobiota bacterium]
MRIFLAALLWISAIFFTPSLPDKSPYPPLLSKKFPLGTPSAFWASLLGMRRVAADIVWIQAFQYYGDRYPDYTELEREKEAELARYPLLLSYWQQVARLDPLFSHAYLTGATTLAWDLKRAPEALELLDEGIDFLEEMGVKFRLDSIIKTEGAHLLLTGKYEYYEELLWRMRTLRTVLIYINNDEFEEALPSLNALARLKDLPDDLKSMLAQIYERNAYYEEAFHLWALLHRNSLDTGLKEIAARRILAIHSKFKARSE